MIRKALILSLYPGQEAEYEKRHNPIWPELESTLKEHGVSNYSIFLDQERNLLFCYAEIENEERWNAIATTPVCRKWWAYMKQVMPTNRDDSPVANALREVFHLD